ncbi:MAG: alpha/beta fold hydrolase [Gemmatimonadales bacterium]|nr:alpha/beta fold hydrolase [Gemmatimonadales bacterium]
MRSALLAIVGVACGMVSLPAQSGARSAALVFLRGNDTIVVERILRSDTNVVAHVIGRGAPRMTLISSLAPGHLIGMMRFFAYGAGSPADAQPLQSGELRFDGDTARLVIRQGANARPLAIATKAGAMPVVNNDFVLVEQGVRRARFLGLQRLQVPLFALAGGVTLDGVLDLFAPDSARFTVAGNQSVVSIDAAGNVTGGYLPGQNIRIVVVEGAAAAAIAFGRPDYAAPAGAPYLVEEVEVKAPAGHMLAGSLTLPIARRGRMPAVITITGSGQQDRDESLPIVPGFRLFRQVADTLARHGIAVLRLDDRGVGGSGGEINGTSADFADDIRAAVAFLRTRPEIDPARIALVGHSEGGMIAPMIAATDRRLAAIVLMAGPAQSGRQIIDYQLGRAVTGDPTIPAASRDSAAAAVRAAFDSTTAKGPWMRYFLAYDPLPTLRRVRQPVLILQGATDRQVTAEQAPLIEQTLRAAGNRRVTSVIFPDRNHLFLRDADGSPTGYASLPGGHVDAEVMGTLVRWLVETLGARPPA